MKTADVLEIPQIKKHAKYFSKHPSLMSSSTLHELKRLASISTQAIIETFSPFSDEVIQAIKTKSINMYNHTTGVTTDRKGKLKIGNQPMNATKTIFDLVTSREEREAANAFSLHKLDIRRRKSQQPMIWEFIGPLFQGMLQRASWV